MIKEEWRLHSSMFGSKMFIFFPVLLCIFTFGFSIFIPMFLAIIDIADIYTLVNYAVLLSGLIVGGFALMGREVMNRRFGQASLVAYSSRTLPVTEKKIISNMILNEIIFYFLLYIIPCYLGFITASLFNGLIFSMSAGFLISIILSFLLGLSTMFFLSTLYVRLGWKVTALLFSAFLAFLLYTQFFIGYNVTTILPSIQYFFTGSFESFFSSIAVILITFSISIFSLKIEFPTKITRTGNDLEKLKEHLHFIFSQSNIVSKDLLDLKRSEGGFGKILFSLIVPLVLIWAMLYIFSGLFSLGESTLFLIFSVLVGALSTSIYNWLTEYENFSTYIFLPVPASEVIRSKLKSYSLLSIAPLLIIIIASSFTGNIFYLIPSIFIFSFISIYTLLITIFLCGLSPNILIYNGRIFLKFVLLVVPVLVVPILLSMINPLLIILELVVLLGLFKPLYKKALVKWDNEEQFSL